MAAGDKVFEGKFGRKELAAAVDAGVTKIRVDRLTSASTARCVITCQSLNRRYMEAGRSYWRDQIFHSPLQRIFTSFKLR